MHIHGGDIYTYQGMLDFSANINPLGLPPAVVQAAAEGAAQAAAQNRHTAHVLHLGGQAQRAYKILKAVALVQLVQRQGGAADLLIDYGNQAVRRTGDGEGNPLSLLRPPAE